MLQSLLVAGLAILPEPGAPAATEANRLAPGGRITVTVQGQPELSGDAVLDQAAEPRTSLRQDRIPTCQRIEKQLAPSR